MGSLSEEYRMFGNTHTVSAPPSAHYTYQSDGPSTYGTVSAFSYTDTTGWSGSSPHYTTGILSVPGGNIGTPSWNYTCDYCGSCGGDEVLSFNSAGKSTTICVECMIFLIKRLGDVFKDELLESRGIQILKPIPTTMPDELFEIKI